ncbi:MAG: M24 family metallopeptidase, partial [Lentisphaeraceae bacterium]|nr:M24 family metallopeptidase [Lentisphaeraceae bacterium]
VGINETAAILHYTELRARSVRNDSMLIDAGALCNGYASDITRTYCKDETSVFAELIRALDVKQLEIREMLRPGTDYVDIHLFAHRCIAQLLSDFGIVKAKADEIVEKGLSKVFFPHGVGHHLGLQVHDAGGYLSDTPGESIRAPDEHPFLRCTRTVEAGNVHTIEPGLYFIEMLLDQIDAADKKLINWDLIEELKVFGGIRIEDNICTLADRSVNYTRGQEKLF